jgi:cysteine desulfurase/selenocysteine lyase
VGSQSPLVEKKSYLKDTTAFTISELDQIREQFPILGRLTASGAPLAFLDNAASTQRPLAVIDAMSDCFRRYYANVHRGIHTLSEESTAAYEQARRTVAEFINAASDREVIFTAGATASINTVARTWGDANLGRGDVILATIAEHHANIVPWHQLAERTGCKVVFLPITSEYTFDDTVVKDHLERLQPKLFAFTAVSNVLGTKTPVRRWAQLAKSFGAVTLVDASQATPHEPIDVQSLDTDFLVFGGHKMCGPTGIGVLHGKQQLLEDMPAFLGGGGMILRVTTEGFEPAELPDKFEAGTPPIAEAIGLAAAANFLTGLGLERIAAHEHALCKIADQGLREMQGVEVIGPDASQKGGIVSFSIDGVHAHDIAQELDHLGIAVRAGHHCTMPLHRWMKKTSTTRASFYLYNRPQEAERFLEAIELVKTKFTRSGRRRRQRNPQ